MSIKAKGATFVFSALVLTLALLLTAGFSFFTPRSNPSPNLPPVNRSIQSLKTPLRVTATLVRQGYIPERITTTAVLSPLRRGNLVSGVSSRIVHIPVTDGQWVDRGDTLVILQDDRIRNNLQQTRGKFFQALLELTSEVQFSEWFRGDLWNDFLEFAVQQPRLPPLPSLQSHNDAMAAIRHNLPALHAQVKEMEEILEQCTVVAPFPGMISNLAIFPGAAVTSGSALMTITDLSFLKAEIRILTEDLNRIGAGTPILMESMSPDTFAIQAILPEVDQGTHTAMAITTIPNPNLIFRQGQSVLVTCIPKVYRNRLLVPHSAVLVRNDRKLVFVVRSGRALWRYIQTGMSSEDLVEVLEGISPGDTVLTDGHVSLAHDVAVQTELVLF